MATNKTRSEQLELTKLVSAGLLTGGSITDAGGGTINVSAGTGFLRTTDSHTGDAIDISWSASAGIAIPSDTVRYIGVEYNGGSPQIVVKAADAWDIHTEFRIGSVVNEAGTLHILDNPWMVANADGHALERFYETQPFQRANRLGGLIIGETGARNVTLTAGELYDATNEFDINALDTSVTGSFDTYLGTVLQAAAQTQWDNLNYDNAGVLTALLPNKWANLWFYIEADDSVVMVYGTASYNTMAGAELESPPSSIPLRIQIQGTILGRCVFKQNAATGLFQSVFGTTFTSTGSSDHTNLSNLTTGDAGHTQFALLAGRSGGQIINGGDATTETLNLLNNPIDANGISILASGVAQSTESNYEALVTDDKDLVNKKFVTDLVSGALILQGDWNASTNTPDITGTTTTGYMWRVSVAGNTNLGGITDWEVNDMAVKSAAGWVKIDNTDIEAVWGNIIGTLANQTDLQNALDAKQDSLTNGVASLTSEEVTQLANINTTTISATQWGYLGVMNQGVATTDDATFADLTLTDDFFFGTGTVFKSSVTGQSQMYLKGNTGNAIYRAEHASSGNSYVELRALSGDSQLNFGSNYNAFTVNTTNLALPMRFRGATDNDLLTVDGVNDRVYIGKSSGTEKFEVDGNGVIDGSLSLLNGTDINEFSIDGTLGGNSDDAVPTEQAVKTYVDGAASGKTDVFVYATLSTTQSNVTGDGVEYPIVFNTETYDTGSNYDNSTGIFTAPATDLYMITVRVILSGITATHNSLAIRLHGTGVNEYIVKNNPYYATIGSTNMVSCITLAVPLIQNDTFSVKVTVGAISKVVDILNAYSGGDATSLTITRIRAV